MLTRRSLFITAAIAALPLAEFSAATSIEIPKTCAELKALIDSMVFAENVTRAYDAEIQLLGFGLAEAKYEGAQIHYDHYLISSPADTEEEGCSAALQSILENISRVDAKQLFWRIAPRWEDRTDWSADLPEFRLIARYSLSSTPRQAPPR